jgi:hypothetical protein
VTHRGSCRPAAGAALDLRPIAPPHNREVDGWPAYPQGDEDRQKLFAWELLRPDVERLREALAGCPDPLRPDCTCAVHEGPVPPQVPAVRIDVAEPAARLPHVAVDPNESGSPRFVGPPEPSDRGAQPEGGGEIGRG